MQTQPAVTYKSYLNTRAATPHHHLPTLKAIQYSTISARVGEGGGGGRPASQGHFSRSRVKVTCQGHVGYLGLAEGYFFFYISRPQFE